jgi:hypothetical protein
MADCCLLATEADFLSSCLLAHTHSYSAQTLKVGQHSCEILVSARKTGVWTQRTTAWIHSVKKNLRSCMELEVCTPKMYFVNTIFISVILCAFLTHMYVCRYYISPRQWIIFLIYICMLNKGEVLNKAHAIVVGTVCHKMNLFWKHCRYV